MFKQRAKKGGNRKVNDDDDDEEEESKPPVKTAVRAPLAVDEVIPSHPLFRVSETGCIYPYNCSSEINRAPQSHANVLSEYCLIICSYDPLLYNCPG
jgi:hypothetical protein